MPTQPTNPAFTAATQRADQIFANAAQASVAAGATARADQMAVQLGYLKDQIHQLCAEAAQTRAALHELHRVCHGMDLEDQDARPTEDEYQAAMAAAAAALGAP